MNVAREAWRPLFLREPVARRGWTLVTRGVRAYLIGVAEDDGTLLKRCADPFELATNLAVHGEEAGLVRGAIETLLADGFLRWEGTAESPGWLGIDRLVTFGADDASTGQGEPEEGDSVDHPGETLTDRRRRLARERKERWRGRHLRSGERVPSVPESVPNSVPGNAPERVPERLSPHSPLSDREKNKQKNRSEERRARVTSVPGSVPQGVPNSVPGNAPERVPSSVPRSDRDRVPAAQRPPEDPGTRGHERVEPQAEHRRYAAQHELDLDHYVQRLRRDPRAKGIATVEAWKVLTKMLERAVAKREQRAAEQRQALGGAA